MIQKESTSSV